MKLERWLHEWDTFLLIMLIGLLAGLVAFMAFDPSPAGCHAAVMHIPGRAYFGWVCAHP